MKFAIKPNFLLVSYCHYVLPHKFKKLWLKYKFMTSAIGFKTLELINKSSILIEIQYLVVMSTLVATCDYTLLHWKIQCSCMSEQNQIQTVNFSFSLAMEPHVTWNYDWRNIKSSFKISQAPWFPFAQKSFWVLAKTM